jgi:eukaryotic translation initiation factor 2C
MALNVLIHHMQLITLRRIFCTNQGSQPLGGGVEAWQGYSQSIRPTPRRMMINIDFHATAFYESGSLIQIVLKILNIRSIEDFKIISDAECLKLEKRLKNLKIYATHRGEDASNRRLRISKLTNTSASNTTFEVNGQQLDIATYFQRTYNIRLQYPFLPCIVTRKEAYLPMEVCNVVEVCKTNLYSLKNKLFFLTVLHVY